MSPDTIAAAAVSATLDRLERAAAEVLPDGIAVARTEDGLRLSAPGLMRRWLTDARVRDLAAIAAREPW